MSGAGVKILADSVLARLKGMEERGGNLTGFNRHFGGYMKGSIDRNFTAQGRPAPWAPLKASTMAGFMYSRKSFWNKRKKDGGRTLSKKGREAKAGRLLLVDKGLMRNSFFSIAGARSIIMASNDPKLKYHVFGTKFMAARNPLLFQAEDVDYYGRGVTEFILTGRIV